MKLRYVWLVVPLLLLGCQAGTSYELLGYDTIQLAAIEAQKGVDAYDQAIRASDGANVAAFKKTLTRNIVKIALSKDETPENAQKLADKIVTDTEAYLNAKMEQERRRNVWYETTTDNLKFIIEKVEDAKQFAIYRSNISAQWKQYLMAQTRAKVATFTGAKPTKE